MYTEKVSKYTNQSLTQRKYDSAYRRDTYIYQSINYTEGVQQCIQNRYLYIPIYQLYRGGRTMYAEEVYINTSQSITQRKKDSVYRRGTYIYQYINYTEEVRLCIQKRYLYIPINKLHRGDNTMYTEEVPI